MGLVAVANGEQVATVNTEHSLTQQTGIGIYVLLVDTVGMQAGDTLVIRLKTKLGSSSSSQTAYTFTFNDVQDEPNKYSVPVPIDTEIICTLQQTAGSSRTFPWKLLRV